MEYEYRGVTFAVERALLGIQVVVRRAAEAKRLDFSRDEIAAVVAYFNRHLPAELAFPEGRSSYLANLVVITEAMVRNAIRVVGQ